MSSTKTETPKSFEEIIERDGELFFTSDGCSMLPLIHARKDILHIVKIDGELQIGDVILFSDLPHHYVLHRILKIKKGQIVTAGDNNYWKDKPIAPNMVLGRLVEIIRQSGETVNVAEDYKNKSYKVVRFFAFKAIWLRLRRIFRKK